MPKQLWIGVVKPKKPEPLLLRLKLLARLSPPKPNSAPWMNCTQGFECKAHPGPSVPTDDEPGSCPRPLRSITLT